tara:strand:+ start:681 stop:1265 length:585 start_codon:yes stop_codon:yes gene_type:complete
LKQKELNNPLKKVLFTSFIVLFLDQITKMLVVVYPPPIEGFEVFGFYWFKIVSITNPGMAFGMEIGGEFGKLFLTLFRILVVGWGVFYVTRLLKENSFPSGLLICFGLIIGGALGNIIDSIFYGIIYQNKALFYGEVVDMLSFPFFTIDLPKWLSFLDTNNDGFTFFAPVFNIADSGIFLGIVSLLLFYRKYFS